MFGIFGSDKQVCLFWDFRNRNLAANNVNEARSHGSVPLHDPDFWTGGEPIARAAKSQKSFRTAPGKLKP